MYYIFLMHVLGFSSNSWVGNFYYSPLDNRICKKGAEVVCGRKKVRKEKRTTWLSKEVKVAEKIRNRHKRWLHTSEDCES